MDNWQKIIEGYANKPDQITSKYIDAKVISVREDYLRADVKFITGQTVNNMLNKSGEEIEIGQNVKVEYTTIPSKGWISLTYGEAKPLGGGGGDEPGDIYNIDNAAIITEAQASSLISDEEVIYVDTATPARVVYGKTGNWFYMNGYPVNFNSYQNITATTGLDAYLETLDDTKVLHECTMYTYFQNNTNHPLYKYEFWTDVSAQQLYINGSDINTTYSVRILSNEYRWQNGEWMSSQTNITRCTNGIKLNNPDRLEDFGFIITTNGVNFNISGTAPKPEYIQANLLFRIVYKSDRDVTFKLNVLNDSTSSYGNLGVYTAIAMDSKAEIIFAKGMTKTSKVVNES